MKVELDRYIEVKPDIRRGKPRIAGRRITVTDVAIGYLLKSTIQGVTGAYLIRFVCIKFHRIFLC